MGMILICKLEDKGEIEPREVWELLEMIQDEKGQQKKRKEGDKDALEVILEALKERQDTREWYYGKEGY